MAEGRNFPLKTLGIEIPKLPLELTWERDLVWVDGPIISLHQSAYRDDYLEFFANGTPKIERFLLFRTSYAELDEYLKSRLPLRDLVKACPDGFVYVRDYNFSSVRTSFLALTDIPEDIMPTSDSLLPMEPTIEAPAKDVDPDSKCLHPSRQPHRHHEWYTAPKKSMYCRACGATAKENNNEKD